MSFTRAISFDFIGWCQGGDSVDENEFRGSRFVFYHGMTHSVYRTFDNVRSHCETLGGHMAIVTSAEQNVSLSDRSSGNTRSTSTILTSNLNL